MRLAPSPSELELVPGPSVTPAPLQSSSPSRRRRRMLKQRQAELAAGPTTCGLVGNEEISCFPNTTTRYNQHDWARFTWNSNLPNFTNSGNLVDIYLYHGDSDELAEKWLRVPNQQGTIGSPVNDSWFGDRGLDWKGTKRPFPMYFVVLQSGSDPAVSARAAAQATFTVTQTTVLDSVASSIASAASSSSAAAAASAASESSVAASLSSAAQAGGLSTGPNGVTGTNGSPANPTTRGAGGSGDLQPGGNGGSSFPKWAIAVVSVLGALALIFFIIFLFLFLRHLRERKRRRELERRGSLGSDTPMIPNDSEAPNSASPSSPLMASAGAAAGPSLVGAARGRTRTSSLASPDGASTTSNDALFSGADAAIMADAFRSALRKPDFADRPVEEGESPGSDPVDNGLLNRELAEEGRDLRSVSSSRGVRVETQSNLSNEDDGTTVQDHGVRQH